MLKEIPRIGLGTWALEGDIAALAYEAVKSGYRHIDCAEIYGNQEKVGDGLKKALDEKLCKREDIWITSKVWNNKHSATDVKQSCVQTLKDLKLEYLDLLLIHWPISQTSDGKLARVPLSETWGAFEQLVDQGLVKHIGVSNFDIQLLNDLLCYCRIRPYTNQVECHPYMAQKNLLEFCQSQNIKLTCYSPLVRCGAGMKNVKQPLEDPVLLEIAKKYGKTVPQIALKWNLQRNEHTIVLPKTSKTSRLLENLKSDFTLKQEDIDKINTLDQYHRVCVTPGPIKVFL